MAIISATIPSDTITNVDINSAAGIARSKLALEVKKLILPLHQLRIFDSATYAQLPNTPASDDLGLNLGSRATTGHRLETSDAKAATVTQKAAGKLYLPPEYEPGGTIQLCSWGGMQTTISDGTATVDFQSYKKAKADWTHGADLVTTGAITINSLTLAEQAFTLTPTGLLVGDELDFELTVAITDAATGTAVLGTISELYALIQVRG